jgi:hypothetical protein
MGKICCWCSTYGKGSSTKCPLRLRVILFTPAPPPTYSKSDIVYGNVYTFGLIIGTCPDVKLIAAVGLTVITPVAVVWTRYRLL